MKTQAITFVKLLVINKAIIIAVLSLIIAISSLFLAKNPNSVFDSPARFIELKAEQELEKQIGLSECGLGECK